MFQCGAELVDTRTEVKCCRKCPIFLDGKTQWMGRLVMFFSLRLGMQYLLSSRSALNTNAGCIKSHLDMSCRDVASSNNFLNVARNTVLI